MAEAHRWTPEEEIFLQKNYQKLSAKELSEKIGVSDNAVRKKLKRIGLEKQASETPTNETISSRKKAEGEKAAPQKERKKRSTVPNVHLNIRCRRCLIVDGYTPEEKTCHYCDAEIYQLDLA